MQFPVTGISGFLEIPTLCPWLKRGPLTSSNESDGCKGGKTGRIEGTWRFDSVASLVL